MVGSATSRMEGPLDETVGVTMWKEWVDGCRNVGCKRLKFNGGMVGCDVKGW